MWKEFKAFVMRGNVLDLAVAVVIAAAFGAVITSFVNDIIMPPIGYLLGGVNFADLFIVLGGGTYDLLTAAKDAGAAVIAYGNFIQVLINFIIIAFVIFLIVKAYNASKKKEEAAPAPPPGPSAEETLLTEIRDILAAK